MRYTSEELPIRWTYRTLRAYYENNGLYDVIREMARGVGAEAQALRPLRNPAHRAVEFYAAKLWPGMLPDALPIVAGNERIVEPIQQVWTWSGWSAAKQVAARWFACYGDWFTKVVVKRDAGGAPQSVYFQIIDAQYVTDLDADERGFLTFLRIDLPRRKREGDGVKSYTYTEVWDKATQTYRVWEHGHGADTALGQLGTPQRQAQFSEFSIDFVPVVHAKFRDVGEARGAGCFVHCLDKIDETNRSATRLHQMLWRHNKAMWALSANMQDSDGRPVPAPLIPRNDDDKVSLSDDEDWVELPGLSTLQPLTPQIQYDAALAVVDAQIAEIERDLPELAYYRLQERSDMSGVAIRTLLSAATDRLVEARGNAETALARLDAMALTIGQNVGLFTGLGTYEDGDFEHSFQTREAFPISPAEEADMLMKWTAAGLPLASALRMLGRGDEEIAQIIEEQTEARAAQTNLGDALLTRFDRGDV